MALSDKQKKNIEQLRSEQSVKDIAFDMGLKKWEVEEYLAELDARDKDIWPRIGKFILRYVLPISLLAVIGFNIYSDCAKNAFVYDDNFLIVKNESFIGNPQNFLKAFVSPLFPHLKNSNFYRPLQIVSFMADYSRWKLNPEGYHSTNILLHVVCSVVFYLLVLLVCGRALPALAASVLYAVHPMNGQAVAYVSGRADSMVALFWMLSLYFYIRNLKESKFLFTNPYFVLSILFFVFSLLSKETAVIFPFILLAYNLSMVRKEDREGSFLCLIFFIIIVGVYLMLRITLLNFSSSSVILGLNIGQLPVHLLTFSKSFLFYAGLLVYPFHPYLQQKLLFVQTDWGLFIFVSIALLGLFVLFLFWVYRRSKRFFFASLWFFIALLPVSGINPLNPGIGYNLHLPLIGILFVAGMGISGLIDAPRESIPRGTGILLLILLPVFWGFINVRQNRIWKNEITLYRWMLKYQDLPRIKLLLGDAYRKAGAYDRAIKEIDSAAGDNPDFYSQYCLGNVYYDMGLFEKAQDFYEKSLQMNTKYAASYGGLGDVFFERGLTEKAIDEYWKAIKNSEPRHPELYRYYYSLGVAHRKKGLDEEALQAFRKSVQLNAVHALSYKVLGDLCVKKELFSDAVRLYRTAISLDPGNPFFHDALGSLYYDRGEYVRAKMEHKKAAELMPESAQLHFKLGNAYAALKEFGLAVESWKRARELDASINITDENIRGLRGETAAEQKAGGL